MSLKLTISETGPESSSSNNIASPNDGCEKVNLVTTSENKNMRIEVELDSKEILIDVGVKDDLSPSRARTLQSPPQQASTNSSLRQINCDTITCGECAKKFRLDQMSEFVNHKVRIPIYLPTCILMLENIWVNHII